MLISDFIGCVPEMGGSYMLLKLFLYLHVQILNRQRKTTDKTKLNRVKENGTGLYLERKDYRVHIQQMKFLWIPFEVSKSRNKATCMCRTISDCTKKLLSGCVATVCTLYTVHIFIFKRDRNYCEYKLSPSYHRHAIFGKHSNKFFPIRSNVIYNMHTKKLFLRCFCSFISTFFCNCRVLSCS